jgi:hypothetical protein
LGFLRRAVDIMRLITRGLALGILGLGLLGLAGCGEDNEAASNESAAKGSATGDVSKVPPPSKTMEDYAKNNPGSGGAGTAKDSGYAGAKRK